MFCIGWCRSLKLSMTPVKQKFIQTLHQETWNFALRIRPWTIMYYICFMDSHSFWCDFWRFNPAVSTAPAKFAFTAHGGTKWQETLEKITFFLLWISVLLYVLDTISDLVCSFSLWENAILANWMNLLKFFWGRTSVTTGRLYLWWQWQKFFFKGNCQDLLLACCTAWALNYMHLICSLVLRTLKSMCDTWNSYDCSC